jgi:hypothetical protein
MLISTPCLMPCSGCSGISYNKRFTDKSWDIDDIIAIVAAGRFLAVASTWLIQNSFHSDISVYWRRYGTGKGSNFTWQRAL